MSHAAINTITTDVHNPVVPANPAPMPAHPSDAVRDDFSYVMGLAYRGEDYFQLAV